MREATFAQRRAPPARRGRDPTDPGGPSPEVLASARADSSPQRTPSSDATVPSGGGKGPGAARLLITAGPHKGAEFTVGDALTTLGRAATNAIAIPDISVSREHLALEKRGDAFLLLDRGSGNGTRVNGRRVRRRRLRHGDEIEIGDSTLRFLEPGGVIACRAPASGAGVPAGPAGALVRHRRAYVQAALALAMMLVVAAAFLRRHRLAGQLEEQARRDATHALALQKLQEGIALLKQGESAGGRGKLAIAAELDAADPEIARAVESAATGEERSAAIAVERQVAPAPVTADPRNSAISRPSPGRGRVSPAVAALSRAQAAAEREGQRALAARHVLAAGELHDDVDLPRAAAHLRAAIEIDPGNGEARAGLERVAGRAKEIYLRAYMAKDDEPDVARSSFQIVVEALPARDETAAKALHWIAKLDAKGPD